MKAFKAFDQNLKCRDYQFEVGKTYKHDGEVKVCMAGFHSCENPLDVLSYYALTDSRFCVVEANGDIKPHNEDSKIASSEITIKKELTLSEYILACINYLVSNTASGDYSKLAASGHYSQLAASGDSSIACNAGINGKVKGGKDCAMSLAYFDLDSKRYRIVVAYVGENGIKQNTWYQLNDKHEFKECEE